MHHVYGTKTEKNVVCKQRLKIGSSHLFKRLFINTRCFMSAVILSIVYAFGQRCNILKQFFKVILRKCSKLFDYNENDNLIQTNGTLHTNLEDRKA